jgi:chromosomal replication initiator protein
MKVNTAQLRQVSSSSLRRFVVLPENRSASRAIRHVAAREINRPGHRRSFPFLFLHGPPGTGKSHLAQGLLERVVEKAHGRSVANVIARDLGHLLTQQSHDDEMVRPHRDCDLLIIEDVQHLPVNAAEPLASLLDHRCRQRRSSIVTSVLGPAMLRCLPMRLTNRLSGGLVVGLQPLSRSSRRHLLQTLIAKRRLHVTAEVIDWLSRMPTGGVRPILGDIARLEQLSRQFPPPLDVATVKSKLAANQNTDTPVERIAIAVSDHFGITLKQMRGRDRHRQLLWPRHVAMYLVRQLTGSSYASIGSFFGGCDHSTILHACRQVECNANENVAFENELNAISALLR